MDNKTDKTYFIKTNFWARARVIVPFNGSSPEDAAEEFKKNAGEFLNLEIRDIEIEQVEDNPEAYGPLNIDDDEEEAGDDTERTIN